MIRFCAPDHLCLEIKLRIMLIKTKEMGPFGREVALAWVTRTRSDPSASGARFAAAGAAPLPRPPS